jgi:hypothetical protein
MMCKTRPFSVSRNASVCRPHIQKVLQPTTCAVVKQRVCYRVQTHGISGVVRKAKSWEVWWRKSEHSFHSRRGKVGVVYWIRCQLNYVGRLYRNSVFWNTALVKTVACLAAAGHAGAILCYNGGSHHMRFFSMALNHGIGKSGFGNV